jgi:hypothetical protein
MAHRIFSNNWRIVQKAEGGLSPILQLQMRRDHGLERAERMIERMVERDRQIADHVRAIVEAERVEAMARGVQVIYEETRDDTYRWVVLPDEGRNSGT